MKTSSRTQTKSILQRTRALLVPAALVLAAGLGGCVYAPPYGYAPAPAYGYAYGPAVYAAPAVSVGVGFGGGGYGHWHGH